MDESVWMKKDEDEKKQSWVSARGPILATEGNDFG